MHLIEQPLSLFILLACSTSKVDGQQELMGLDFFTKLLHGRVQ